jgi:hypothetical protein
MAITSGADLSIIEGRLTAARAGYIDNLSAGAAALQASSDTLESRLSAARAGYFDNLSGGAAALQSTLSSVPTSNKPTVDRGVIAMGTLGSATATIGAVTMANSECRFLGYQTNATDGNNNDTQTYVMLTNTTTVTAIRYNDGGHSVWLSWEVSEY